MNTPSYPFADWNYSETLDNRQLVLQLTEKFKELDSNVYIQDVSFLGFPSVYVVAEGVSEIRCRDLFHLKEIKLMLNVMSHLSHIDDVSDDQIREIIQLAKLKRGAVLENTINNFYKMPFNRSFYTLNELNFLLFACYYQLGDIEASLRALGDCRHPAEGERQFLDAVKKYVQAKAEGLDERIIREVLSRLCDSETVSRVLDIFGDSCSTLRKLYPVCNRFMCDTCNLDCCEYPALVDFERKIASRLDEWTGGADKLHLIFE